MTLSFRQIAGAVGEHAKIRVRRDVFWSQRKRLLEEFLGRGRIVTLECCHALRDQAIRFGCSSVGLFIVTTSLCCA